MIRYNTREEFCEGQTSIFDPKIEPFFIVKGNSGEYLVCEENYYIIRSPPIKWRRSNRSKSSLLPYHF